MKELLTTVIGFIVLLLLAVAVTLFGGMFYALTGM